MAFPTILFDSTTGSDTAASGAGPTTAVTGTKGRTRNTASQLQVGFFESSPPDLSGVATDGSAALFLSIATAGQRNFSSIAAVKNTQQTDVGSITSGAAVLSAIGSTTGWTAGDVVKVAGAGAAAADLYSTILSVDSGTQVTLNDNAGTTVSGAAVVNPKQVNLTASQGLNTGTTDTTWAIGGKRASFFSATSKLLWNNNTGNGDAMPGWTMQIQSTHVEPATATQFKPFRSGDTTNGPITVQGQSGSSPVLTSSANAIFFLLSQSASYWVFQDFELQNTNVTKTTSVGFEVSDSSYGTTLRRVKIKDATNHFWKACYWDPNFGKVLDCEFAHSTNIGLSIPGCPVADIINNWIHDNGSDGVNISGTAGDLNILGNAIANNAGNGITCSGTNAASGSRGNLIGWNTIDANTGDGVKITPNDPQYVGEHCLLNNQVNNNGGYWLDVSGTINTDIGLLATGLTVLGNNHYANGNSNLAHPNLAITEQYGTSVNPQYNNAAAGDYTVTNPAAKGIAYPPGGTLTVGKTSATNSYPTAGAAAPNPAAAAGGFRRVGLNGGF